VQARIGPHDQVRPHPSGPWQSSRWPHPVIPVQARDPGPGGAGTAVGSGAALGSWAGTVAIGGVEGSLAVATGTGLAGGGGGVAGAPVSMLVEGPEDGVALTAQPSAAPQRSRLTLAARAAAGLLAVTRMPALRPARSRRRPSRG
jgi:hypothetical protein